MSRISHKYKFIYFAYPKTASTSVREVLDPFSDIIAGNYKDRTPENPFYNHITAAETKQIFEERGWDYNSYFKFVVIRNPWSRLVSLYNMTECKITTFKDWIFKQKNKANSACIDKWKSNGVYSLLNFAGNGSELLVDCVLRLEDNFDKELQNVFQKIGLPQLQLPQTIPKLNVAKYHLPSYGSDWRKYYTDPATKIKMKELYGWEMKEYKYSFY